MGRLLIAVCLLCAPATLIAQDGAKKAPAEASAKDKAAKDGKQEAGKPATTAAPAAPAAAAAVAAPAPQPVAAPPVEAAPKTEKNLKKGGVATILEYLDKGGWMMYVILIVSILGMGIFFERGFVMFMQQRLNASGFIATIMSHVESRQYRQAIDACKVGSKHPLVNIMRAGIMRTNRREAEIERAMEKEMLDALPTSEQTHWIAQLFGKQLHSTWAVGDNYWSYRSV